MTAVVAVIVASLALVVSSFQAWRSWSARNDYAKGTIIARRIEASTEFLFALDKLEDQYVAVLSAIELSERSQIPRDEAIKAAIELSALYNQLDCASSKVRILFPGAVGTRALEIVGDQVKQCRLAHEAAQGPNPQREEFRGFAKTFLIDIKREWSSLVRAAFVADLDSFFPRRTARATVSAIFAKRH